MSAVIDEQGAIARRYISGLLTEAIRSNAHGLQILESMRGRPVEASRIACNVTSFDARLDLWLAMHNAANGRAQECMLAIQQLIERQASEYAEGFES